MTSERVVLGTYAIYVNSLSTGLLEDHKQKYGLIYGFRNSNGVVEKGFKLFQIENFKEI